MSPADHLFCLVSFEGPDDYARVGDLAEYVTAMALQRVGNRHLTLVAGRDVRFVSHDPEVLRAGIAATRSVFPLNEGADDALMALLGEAAQSAKPYQPRRRRLAPADEVSRAHRRKSLESASVSQAARSPN